MFIVSKIFWLLAAPDNFFLALLVVGIGLAWRGRGKAGLRLASVAVAFYVAVLVLPLDAWLFIPLENRFPAVGVDNGPVDGIIVLGGGLDPELSSERDQFCLGCAAGRLAYFLILAREHPQAKLVFSGGSGDLLEQRYREARFMPDLMRKLGLDPGRVILEDASRNTAENALFSKALAKPAKGERWLLVTSAFHMPRAVGVFRALDWEVEPFPVDYRTAGKARMNIQDSFADKLRGVNTAWREWVGLAAYRLLGRTRTLFPGPRSVGSS